MADNHPNASRRSLRDFFTHVVILSAVILSIRYFYWRATETMNPAAKWFFYLFLAAELLNFLESLLFYFTTWTRKLRSSPKPLPHRSVDVFIATYNEPVELLRETVVCAVSMRYPHKTYILDDGNRPEVRDLAVAMNCGYINRMERTQAKAGNLNNALKQTDGEFIVTLDADHVPMPDLIEQVIGFFADPKAAIVQTSQDFYNLDSFQHVTQWKNKYAWQQQELFFSVIQPGKDRFNATMYCGSPAMVRRVALEQIGGFAGETITEDMHTGLRLQKKGWRVIYYNRSLARGLAPQTFNGFAAQWWRWGHGAMQVLRAEKPLFGKGLTLGQRICYFSSFYFYWMSYQKFFYILTPIFCLLTGIFPLVAEPDRFAIYFIPYFLLNLAASSLLQGGLFGFWLSEQFNLVKLSILARSISGFFQKDSKFSVTPKARGGAARWRDIASQIILLAALFVGLAAGSRRVYFSEPGFQFWALVVNLIWVIIFVILTVPILLRAMSRSEFRSTYRFTHSLDVPAKLMMPSGGGPDRLWGYARNLNRQGFSVSYETAIPIGTPVAIELEIPGHFLRCRGTVVRSQDLWVKKKKLVISGIRFDQIDPADQDAISTYLFCKIAPRQGNMLQLTRDSQQEEPRGS